MAMKQEANTPVVLTIGAMSGLLILVIYFGVEAWFRYEERNEMDIQWQNSPNTWLIELRKPQLDHLAATGVDPKTGAKHTPISVAMSDFVVKTNLGAPATQPTTEPAAPPITSPTTLPTTEPASQPASRPASAP